MFAKTKFVENMTYPSGNTYTGEMKSNKRNGQGKLTWADGTTYEGQWVKNQQHGKGKYTFPNGTEFEGDFVKNNINGRGTLQTPSETITGVFQFKRRFVTTDGKHFPVAEYLLDVNVQSNGRSMPYRGTATFHLNSGKFVLPDMADPNQGFFQQVEAIVITSPAEEGMTDTKGVAVAQATPVEMVEIKDVGSANQGVSFGQKDEAYQKELKFKRKPANLLDPRNYF